nr:uncharacterized protein LOC116773801 [Danaus plexippus plexippus]
MYAVELGARGITAKSLYNLLKVLGLSRTTVSSFLERTLKEALVGSFQIWLGRERSLDSGVLKHFCCCARSERGEMSSSVISQWKERLSQPKAGLATIAAVRPLFEEWLKRRHGVLTFRLTQVRTGHESFRRYLFHIQREESPGCRHCDDQPENTVEHTVAECPAWAEHRRVLRAAIGGGDLSRPALIQAMVRSKQSC